MRNSLICDDNDRRRTNKEEPNLYGRGDKFIEDENELFRSLLQSRSLGVVATTGNILSR